MTQEKSREVQDEEMKEIAEAQGKIEKETVIVIVGGYDRGGYDLLTAEVFSLTTRTWTTLPQRTQEPRHGASSGVYDNELLVVGGKSCRFIEKLSLNAIHDVKALPWKIIPAELPGQLAGHRSVVYNGRLIVIGGCGDKLPCTDCIYEISLSPPYTSRLLATIPQKRYYHGVAIFGDKILIVGGEGGVCQSPLRSVVMYDITKNECQELAPLPYPVSEMATVKWNDDSVMIMGGIDSIDQPLKNVLIYNIKTQKTKMLPDMKYARKGCVAAVVKDTVIVMGGRDDKKIALESVESFRFDRYTWEELPEMHEARVYATAVAYQQPIVVTDKSETGDVAKIQERQTQFESQQFHLKHGLMPREFGLASGIETNIPIGNLSLDEGQTHAAWHVKSELGSVGKMVKMIQETGDVQGKRLSITKETSPEVMTEYRLKTTEGDTRIKDIDEDVIIVIAGGETVEGISNSVEIHGNWTPLVPMIEGRSDASSVLYNGQFIVTGGLTSQGLTNTMEKLSLNPDRTDTTTTWENVPVELPGRLVGHRIVIHNRRLIVIGGYYYENENDRDGTYSNSITEIPLVSPGEGRLLTTMLDRRSHHGVAIFGDKILILGGKDGITGRSIFGSVYMYNITENSFEELRPLPHPVCEMATIKWGNDNVIIMGGVDRNLQPLNEVLMYKISTQKDYELPPMNYARKGCVAVVSGNNVIVMGGKGINGECLKSVEKFNFRNYAWEELPEMQEGRYCATAVAY